MDRNDTLQSTPPIFTIGYGKRHIGDFVKLLVAQEIQCLIDVRSFPFAKYNKDFSQATLKGYLEAEGIIYRDLGKELGGRPQGSQYYNDDNRVNYTVLSQSEPFKSGIKKLLDAVGKKFRCVLMCSEERPSQCHRTKLIGEVLIMHNIELQHIDECGKVLSHAKVIEQIISPIIQNQLFSDQQPENLDRKLLLEQSIHTYSSSGKFRDDA